MSTQPTPTGWIDTVVTEHKILEAWFFDTVKHRNGFNLRNPGNPYNYFVCNRCQTFWSSLPESQHIMICIMNDEKKVNQFICEECASEIDQSLIIK